MKRYATINGKSASAALWGDKVPTKIKKVFKKSARQESKRIIRKNLK